MAQLELFESPDAFEKPREWSRWAKVGSALPRNVRFGTSSWTFEGWEKIVYFRRYKNRTEFVKRSLEEYGKHPLLRTVCLDRSYYRPIPEEQLLAYRHQVPDDFRFVHKVWNELATRMFTRGERAGHFNKNFLNPDIFEEQILRPHRNTLGTQSPFLVCIPPAGGPVNARGFADRVDAFLERAQKFEAKVAFEVRDRRLLDDPYLRVLERYRAGHVYNFWRNMPSLAAQRRRTGTLSGPLFLRLMLPPEKRFEETREAFAPFDRIQIPQPSMRQEVIELVSEAIRQKNDAWVIVNNKAEGCSPLTIAGIATQLTIPEAE